MLTLPRRAEDFPCGTELLGHKGPVSCCSFSTDGGSLATGGRDQVSHRRMQSWYLHLLGPTAPLLPGLLNSSIPIASSGFLLCQTSVGSAHPPFNDVPSCLETSFLKWPWCSCFPPMVLTAPSFGTYPESPLLGCEDTHSPSSDLLLLCLSP